MAVTAAVTATAAVLELSTAPSESLSEFCVSGRSSEREKSDDNWEKIQKKMADTSWRQELQAGSLIDAMDGDDMWYEATVQTANQKTLTVRFLGWSKKWNATLQRTSKRVAPRNSKVPNWRLTLRPGKAVEVSSDSSTWCSSVCSRMDYDKNRFEIIRSPGCTREWFRLDSPLVAEPYTHCGYKVEADSSERRRMLTARRALFEEELRQLAHEKMVTKHASVGLAMGSMVNNPELSDVQFKIEDKVVYGHRMMLATRSPYFRSMLLGGLAEAHQDTPIPIPDMTYETFMATLAFVYTGGVTITHENVFELLEASHLFCLEELSERLEKYLAESITDDTAIEILIASKAFSLDVLAEKCLAHVIANYDKFNEKDAFKLLQGQPSLLLEILKRINNPSLKSCNVSEQKEEPNKMAKDKTAVSEKSPVGSRQNYRFRINSR